MPLLKNLSVHTSDSCRETYAASAASQRVACTHLPQAQPQPQDHDPPILTILQGIVQVLITRDTKHTAILQLLRRMM
jgi:hypothetical protein